MAKRIVIAGGGTGGHIFPAVAVAQALKQQDPSVEILFVGARNKMEMEKVPAAGFNIRGIDIAGFNRSHLLKNISLPFKLLKSFIQVRSIFKAFKPDAVFGVGGYSSFPVLRYAQSQGIATYLHEANAFAGKANMMLGKKAKQIFVAHYGMEKFFDSSKLMITGNPVRKQLVNTAISQDDAAKHFGLDPAKTTVLVVGGSLGARSINKAILAGLDRILNGELQLIWQTGNLFIDEAKAAAAKYNGVYVSAFIDRMDMAYAAAHAVVSRSGAMSVTEISLLAKPAIFVPYPFAAEDHQTANAQSLADKQAAILVKDDDAQNQLVLQIMMLATNSHRLQEITEHVKAMEVHAEADTIIAKTILGKN